MRLPESLCFVQKQGGYERIGEHGNPLTVDLGPKVWDAKELAFVKYSKN